MGRSAWILRGLLGCLWILPVLMTPTPPALCTSMKTLKESLTHRRRYMKHNFPLNYTIQVHYEESFKLSNISRLRARVADLEEVDLQEVWLLVNQEVLKKVLRVLPEKHPSRRYTAELEQLFRKVEQVFHQRSDEREPPERVQEIWDRVKDPASPGWRSDTPKTLLNNCYKTMHCLFTSCFPSQDQEGPQNYCGAPHWRRGRKKLQQLT